MVVGMIRCCISSLLVAVSLVILSCSYALEDGVVLPTTPIPAPPRLSGHHLLLTVVEQLEYIDITEDEDGKLSFSGYLIDILEEIAREERANFTYELRTPSGFGSSCRPRLDYTTVGGDEEGFLADSKHRLQPHPYAYHPRYYKQYTCAESDVTDLPKSNFTTDLYWGWFYITPERLLRSKFTVPYRPPSIGRLSMIGTATKVRDMQDLIDNHPSLHEKICSYENTAMIRVLRQNYPQLTFHGLNFNEGETYQALLDGKCEIIFESHAYGEQFISQQYQKGQCKVNGKPIGMIGKPFEYGLNHYAFGIRNDIPTEVVQALNFWLEALMSCFPSDPNGFCYKETIGGSLSELYSIRLGAGNECGYVQFPSDGKLSATKLAACIVTPLVVLLLILLLYHVKKMKQQDARMKKRFVEQIARNLDLESSARTTISSHRISEAYKTIGGADGLISKDDLAKWMMDADIDFVSKPDFDRLWHTMDIDRTGCVDPILFFSFLQECEKQFAEVTKESSRDHSHSFSEASSLPSGATPSADVTKPSSMEAKLHVMAEEEEHDEQRTDNDHERRDGIPSREELGY